LVRVDLLIGLAVLMIGSVGCTSMPRLASSPAEATRIAAPVLIATAAPTAAPSPRASTPTPIAPPVIVVAGTPDAPGTLRVANTGGQGLTLRRTPGGAALATLPDGTAVSPIGEEQEAAGRRWRQVREMSGREGWVAADFLVAEPGSADAPPSPVAAPAPSATPEPPPSATPTWPVPLIPTATYGAQAAPTRTRVPIGSPAPSGTAVPVLVPRSAPTSRP
jgi:hypothetical protein